MENTGVLMGKRSYPTGLWGAALLAGAALLLAAPSESASAAQIVGRDGKVNACYKAKGKRKGSVRLVARSARCRKGERKVSWGVAGPAGPQGQPGATGTAGAAGGNGAAGTAGSESQLVELTERVAALEATLKGVTNEALTSALADVGALCTQATKLTSQVNSLGGALEGTALGGIIPLGLELLVPGLPADLPAFSCP